MSIRLEMNPKQWKMVAESSTINAYIPTIIDHHSTMFVRTGPGIYFCVAVPDYALKNIASKETVLFLEGQPRLAGSIVIGRMIVKPEIEAPEIFWPITDTDPSLSDHLEKSLIHFCNLINNYTQWRSFHTFLMTDIGYNLEKVAPTKQFPFEYWWLVGEKNTEQHLHGVSIYEDKGVYIRPEDSLLPVFTSSLYADIAAQNYAQRYGVNLIPHEIHCLGCFLKGIAYELGRNLISGALLNDQWPIEFFSCDKGHMHCTLNDGDGFSFALVGCRDKGGPVWAERRWDKDGMWFSPPCSPRKW